MLSETLAYLAGIIDGEGSIYGSSFSKYYRFHLKISNTNYNLLIEIINKFNEINIPAKINESGNNTKGKKWKKGYEITICKKSYLIDSLIKLNPYLIAKKEQAQLILKCFSNEISKDECYTKLKLLNKKGIEL